MKDIENLLEKYSNGSCTAAEKLDIEAWLDAHHIENNQWDNMTEADRQLLLSSLFNDINVEIANRERKTIRLWPRIAAISTSWKIAAAVAAITLGVWLYYASSIGGRHAEFSSASPLANDIKPGKNTATLTLANGKTIELSDAKTGVVISGDRLTYNDGAEIPDQVRHDVGVRYGKVQMLTASTPRGGQYQVVLPDGTKVWLNADSKITFPSQFSGKERKVLLEGEAYFVVVHNAKQPFRVESKGQVVEDIGTEFNISAYTDEKTVKTTLVEGSASVSSLRGRTEESRGNLFGRGPFTTPGEAVTLRPNQQSILNGGALQVKEIKVASAIDWKNGEFIFDDEPLESIMRKLARWYDVEVIYQEADKARLFGGGVSRYDHISSVLSKLEKTGGVHFKIEGRKVFVTK